MPEFRYWYYYHMLRSVGRRQNSAVGSQPGATGAWIESPAAGNKVFFTGLLASYALKWSLHQAKNCPMVEVSTTINALRQDQTLFRRVKIRYLQVSGIKQYIFYLQSISTRKKSPLSIVSPIFFIKMKSATLCRPVEKYPFISAFLFFSHFCGMFQTADVSLVQRQICGRLVVTHCTCSIL